MNGRRAQTLRTPTGAAHDPFSRHRKINLRICDSAGTPGSRLRARWSALRFDIREGNSVMDRTGDRAGYIRCRDARARHPSRSNLRPKRLASCALYTAGLADIRFVYVFDILLRSPL